MFECFKDKIIVIEGADGCGKDTVVNILHERLTDNLVVRFPNRNNFSGHYIRDILGKKCAFPDGSYFQALQLANKVETLVDIEKEICMPKWFIFCRYYESSLVYGLIDGLPVEWSHKINEVLPKSFLTFVLYGKNYGHNTEHYEVKEVQDKVSNLYKELSKKYGWILIENNKTPDEIADEIIGHIKRNINESNKNK